MSQHTFRIETSSRIQRLPPYLFGRINKMKYEKRVAGVDIIDLGNGQSHRSDARGGGAETGRGGPRPAQPPL